MTEVSEQKKQDDHCRKLIYRLNRKALAEVLGIDRPTKDSADRLRAKLLKDYNNGVVSPDDLERAYTP